MYTDTDLPEMTEAKRFVLLKEMMQIERFENLPDMTQKDIVLTTMR